MAQEYKDKQSSKKETDPPTEEQPVDLVNEELDQDVEDLLDEIDEVLEENAETFVSQFIQQGGE